MKEIKLNKVKGQQGLVALVNDEDYELVNQYNWFAGKSRNTYYALTYIRVDGKRTTLQMH